MKTIGPGKIPEPKEEVPDEEENQEDVEDEEGNPEIDERGTKRRGRPRKYPVTDRRLVKPDKTYYDRENLYQDPDMRVIDDQQLKRKIPNQRNEEEDEDEEETHNKNTYLNRGQAQSQNRQTYQPIPANRPDRRNLGNNPNNNRNPNNRLPLPNRNINNQRFPQRYPQQGYGQDGLIQRIKNLEALNEQRVGSKIGNIGLVMIPDHGNMLDHIEDFVVERDDRTKSAIAIFGRPKNPREKVKAAFKKILGKHKEIRTQFNDALAFPTPTGWLAFFDVKNYDQIPLTDNDELRNIVMRANKELKHVIQDIVIMNETGNDIMKGKESFWEKYGIQLLQAVAIMLSGMAIIYLAIQLPNIGAESGKAAGQVVAQQIVSALTTNGFAHTIVTTIPTNTV